MAGPGQGGLEPQAPRSTGHTASAPDPRPDPDLWDVCVCVGGEEGGDYRQTIREDHPRWQQGMTAAHMHRNSQIFIHSRQRLYMPFDTRVNLTL